MRVELNIWQPIVYIGLLNFVLIMVMLVMATGIMAKPAGVTLSVSKTIEPAENKRSVDIKITAENVIYVDDRVMTINELRKTLASPQLRGGIINIRSDKRSSMGRVMDVLGLCRGIIQGQVNVTSLE